MARMARPPITIPAIAPPLRVDLCAAAEADGDGVADEVGDAPSTGRASPGASWYAAFLAVAICLSMD